MVDEAWLATIAFTANGLGVRLNGRKRTWMDHSAGLDVRDGHDRWDGQERGMAVSTSLGYPNSGDAAVGPQAAPANRDVSSRFFFVHATRTNATIDPSGEICGLPIQVNS